MSCKCYKTINKPHSYVKSTNKGYKRITVINESFMTQAKTSHFQNRNRELFEDISEDEFNKVWDRYRALDTDIEIEALE